MALQRHEIETWLGPALEDLTADQVDAVHAAAVRIEARWSDQDEQGERDAALSAVVQYLLGETTLADAGRELDEARVRYAEAMAAAQGVALAAVTAGVSESEAARAARVDRMMVRRMLGKR